MRIPSLLLTIVAAAAVLLVPTVVPAGAATPAAALVLGLLVGAVAGVWPRVTGLRPALASSAVLALSGGAALATSLALPIDAALAWWPACLAVGLLLMFVVQLLRGHEAQGKVGALSAGAAGLLVVVSAAGWGVWLRQAGELGSLPSGALWAAGGSIVALGLLAVALLRSVISGWGAEQADETGDTLRLGRLAWVLAGLACVLAAGLPAALLAQLVA